MVLGDEIGELLDVNCIVMMIGERPGLSVSDSLSLYMTWHPRVGRQDSERNCISNIHDHGLSIGEACHKLCWLLKAGRRLGRSGVSLKDASTDMKILSQQKNIPNHSFRTALARCNSGPAREHSDFSLRPYPIAPAYAFFAAALCLG